MNQFKFYYLVLLYRNMKNLIPDTFDWKYYIYIHPDLSAAGINDENKAKKHYLKYGKNENREFTYVAPGFDWIYYLKINHDLPAAGINDENRAIKHYLKYGKNENREFTYVSPRFDWRYYVNKYPDLVSAGINDEKKAKYHYMCYGRKENRQIFEQKNPLLTNFDGSYSIAKNLGLLTTGDIDNRRTDIYINHPNKKLNKPYISIVMPFYNRKTQFQYTLTTISRSIYKNIEIIVVDDGSNSANDIKSLIDQSEILIKYKRIPNDQKNYDNPCVPFNVGLNYVTGDIVILQNPEVCHVTDILDYVANNLQMNDHISFSCLESPDYHSNNQIMQNMFPKYSNRKHNIWYNHPQFSALHFHFCSAMFTKNIVKVRGFSIEYKNGYCFDDHDFVLKMKEVLKLNLVIVPPESHYVIHQYHDLNIANGCTAYKDDNLLKIKWTKNKNLFEQKSNFFEKFKMTSKNLIPKIFNTYWNKPQMSFLNYLTLKTFIYYHPSWEIRIYVPVDFVGSKSISENKNVKNYWENILRNKSVNVITLDLQSSQLGSGIKWHVLSTTGGLWSDNDIFYINSVENLLFNDEDDYDTLLCSQNNSYLTGFMLSKPSNDLFKDCSNQLLHAPSAIINSKIKIRNCYVYMPFQSANIDKIFTRNCLSEIYSNSIGMQWFDGSIEGDQYSKNIDNIQNNSTISVLVNRFLEIISTDSFEKEIVILNPNYK
ncbi:MAG: glycosyltransferase family 2 [Hyperionvirus sp.]|uniref:Glycosyltransferase family 2 n=1 Tax=Hyperionvirus sp. TaxID=2487770 RepID=A0A3G5AB74_9VIRU|nr:MAG: glycosyltransferase family 2 [Hyperionvirus sp.]